MEFQSLLLQINELENENRVERSRYNGTLIFQLLSHEVNLFLAEEVALHANTKKELKTCEYTSFQVHIGFLFSSARSFREEGREPNVAGEGRCIGDNKGQSVRKFFVSFLTQTKETKLSSNSSRRSKIQSQVSRLQYSRA